MWWLCVCVCVAGAPGWIVSTHRPPARVSSHLPSPLCSLCLWVCVFYPVVCVFLLQRSVFMRVCLCVCLCVCVFVCLCVCVLPSLALADHLQVCHRDHHLSSDPARNSLSLLYLSIFKSFQDILAEIWGRRVGDPQFVGWNMRSGKKEKRAALIPVQCSFW